MARTNPKSLRLEEDVATVVEQWLEVNQSAGMDFSALANRALRAYVTQPHNIELKAVTFAEASKMIGGIMQDYKKAIDELK